MGASAVAAVNETINVYVKDEILGLYEFMIQHKAY